MSGWRRRAGVHSAGRLASGGMGKFVYSMAGHSRNGFCPHSTPRAANPVKTIASTVRKRMGAQNRSQNNIPNTWFFCAMVRKAYLPGEEPSDSGITVLLLRVVFQALSPHQESPL